jgi:hypothetical protein
MIVVSYGVQKSGSTLAFEMLCAILELHGHRQEKLPGHLVSPTARVNQVGRWTDEILGELIERSRGTAIALKTHTSPPADCNARIRESLAMDELKIHVVYRDPRDTILSMIDDGVRARTLDRGTSHLDVRTVDDAITMLGPRLAHLRRWGGFPSLHLRYEDFAFEAVVGPRLIARDVGMDADPDYVWGVVQSKYTRRNVARVHRHVTDLWPEESARIERAFPMFLALVRGNPCAGWFEVPE